MTKQKSSSYPSNLLFVDCETKGVIDNEQREVSRHYLWFGYCTAFEYRKGKRTRQKSLFFTSLFEFWRFVETRIQYGKPLYIFAHNITFDLTVLNVWRLSEEHDWEVEFAVIDDPPVIIKFDIGGKKLVLLDTFNYFKCSVADLGKSIGLSKLEMPKSKVLNDAWRKYCKRDVDVICDATLRMFDFFTKNELGGFAYTIAGLALNTYKRKFMKHEIYIHDNNTINDLERSSYFGGLVECYFIGEQKQKTIYVLDVNSMYPYVMQREFPCKLLYTKNKVDTSEVKKILHNFAVIARVEINSVSRTYPIKYEGKLIYANGSFETTLVGPELEKALSFGDVSKISRIAVYDKAPIFKDYVEYFWNLRQDYKKLGDDVNVMFVKYLLNSLYGKFGQQLNTWQPLTLETLFYMYHAYGIEYPKEYHYQLPKIKITGVQGIWYPIGFDTPIAIRKVSTQLQIRVPRGEHNESFPAIASYVTAYAREYLSDLRECGGRRNVFYCDTDSIICNRTARRNFAKKGLLSNTEIGKLKEEMKCNYANFFGLKDYIVGNIIKTKGVRKDAIQIGDNEFMQNQFEGLKSVLKREREPYITISWIRKNLSREYTKGLITKSGWVKPITL